jgi:hypothetical protein
MLYVLLHDPPLSLEFVFKLCVSVMDVDSLIREVLNQYL